MERMINGVPYSTMDQVTVKENFKYHLAADALKEVMKHFDYENLQRIADIIDGAKNVFVAGRGRSRQTAMNFGQRLAQFGKSVYVVGMPTAPSIGKGDVLVLSSGSGSTPTLVDFAKTALAEGAKVVLFTASRGAEVAKLGADTFYVSDYNYQDDSGADREIYQQIYAYYDYPTNLVLETVLTYLMQKNGITREQAEAEKPNLF